jgi:prophage regulatory protein
MASKGETSIKRTIRRQQLRATVPLADSTIYEMEQRGEFPRRFALSPPYVVWDLSEVEAWLASRRSAPIARAQHPDVTQRRSRPVREPGRALAAASKGDEYRDALLARDPSVDDIRPLLHHMGGAELRTLPCCRFRATNGRLRAQGTSRSSRC